MGDDLRVGICREAVVKRGPSRGGCVDRRVNANVHLAHSPRQGSLPFRPIPPAPPPTLSHRQPVSTSRLVHLAELKTRSNDPPRRHIPKPPPSLT